MIGRNSRNYHSVLQSQQKWTTEKDNEDYSREFDLYNNSALGMSTQI